MYISGPLIRHIASVHLTAPVARVQAVHRVPTKSHVAQLGFKVSLQELLLYIMASVFCCRKLSVIDINGILWLFELVNASCMPIASHSCCMLFASCHMLPDLCMLHAFCILSHVACMLHAYMYIGQAGYG